MSNRTVASGIAKLIIGLVALVALAHADNATAQAILGVVRIHNPHQFPAQVYTQNLNAFGVPQWIPIATVPPRSFIDLPRVPNGQWFGLQLSNGYNFPPFVAAFRNPYQAFFEYLPP